MNGKSPAQVIRTLLYSEASDSSSAPDTIPRRCCGHQAGVDVQLRFWGDEEDPGSIVSKEATAPNDRVKGFSIIRQAAS